MNKILAGIVLGLLWFIAFGAFAMMAAALTPPSLLADSWFDRYILWPTIIIWTLGGAVFVFGATAFGWGM